MAQESACMPLTCGATGVDFGNMFVFTALCISSHILCLFAAKDPGEQAELLNFILS